MLNEELHKYLSTFARQVVKQSRTNLTKRKKNASKGLYESLGYDLNVSKNSFSLFFEMADYGKFVDQGVSGKKKKYNTPFKYTTKMPPSKVFNKWAVRKGLAPRDKNGKFIKRKSLNYLLARHIYNNGIKPSLFFTKPFEAAFKNLPDEALEKFGLDVDNFLEHTTKDL